MASSSRQSGKVATAGMSEEIISAAIEVSRVQGWSELKDDAHDGAANSCHAGTSTAIWEELKRSYPHLFRDLHGFQLGRVTAEGGQATIFEAFTNNGADYDRVAEVYKMESFSLADLQRLWPPAAKTPVIESDP